MLIMSSILHLGKSGLPKKVSTASDMCGKILGFYFLVIFHDDGGDDGTGNGDGDGGNGDDNDVCHDDM